MTFLSNKVNKVKLQITWNKIHNEEDSLLIWVFLNITFTGTAYLFHDWLNKIIEDCDKTVMEILHLNLGYFGHQFRWIWRDETDWRFMRRKIPDKANPFSDFSTSDHWTWSVLHLRGNNLMDSDPRNTFWTIFPVRWN